MRPGEVWIVDLGYKGKTRPAVVVSREDPDSPRSLVVCVPLTRECRGSRYEVPLPRVPFLRELSWANVQGIQSVETAHLERPIGQVPAGVLAGLRKALAWMFEL
jgi:mRNA interferase MazF